VSTKILVVDDEQSLAKVVASYLERDGHQVHCAFDGPTAVTAAREHLPDVVVLDIGLPGFDGLEVCRRVQAERPRTVLPRERLLADVWGWADASGTRTVDSHIKGLRRKLGADLIRTVHGVGYALEVPR
jgi:DNA-binding response OmpR family regulator